MDPANSVWWWSNPVDGEREGPGKKETGSVGVTESQMLSFQ